MRGDMYDGGCLGSRGSRVWLFVGFVMGFASVIAACWILFANFVEAGMPVPLCIFLQLHICVIEIFCRSPTSMAGNCSVSPKCADICGVVDI